MKQKLTVPVEPPARPLAINLNLGFFAFSGLVVVLYIGFLGRGMYFKPELFCGLMVLAAALFLAAGDLIIRGDSDLFRTPVDFLAGGLAALYLLAIWGAASTPEAVAGGLKNLGYFAAYLIAAQVVRSWRDFRRLAEALDCGAILVALVGLGAAAGTLNYPGAFLGKTILSSLQYSNALAILMVAGSLLNFSLWAAKLAQARKGPFEELWYLGGLVLMNTALLGTGSRAVWVIYPLLLAIWLFGQNRELWPALFLRVSYLLIASILLSRGFLNRVELGRDAAALSLMIGGLLFTLGGWLLVYRVNHWIRKQPASPAVRKFWQGLGVAYLLVVLAAYGFYTFRSLPGGLDAMLPAEVTNQLAGVSTADRSFQSRLIFYRDSLRIIGDHFLRGTGGGGWAALYHRYQSEPYTSAELHNAFLQTAVETGIPGLVLFIGLWGSSFYGAFRLYRRFRRDPNWPLVCGAAVALLGLGLHSMIDFDLSLPGLSLLTWTLFGLLRNSRKLAHPERGLPAINGAQRGTVLVCGAILGLLLLLPSYSLYTAGKLGAAGAQAMVAGQLQTAEQNLRTAALRDPFSGSYLVDLARINLVYWLRDNDQERLKQGILLAEQGVRKEPNNLRLVGGLIATYSAAGMNDQGVAAAERFVAANPFEIQGYEALAMVAVKSGENYRKRGDLARMIFSLGKVTAIPGQLEKKRAQASKASGKSYQYVNLLQPTPKINLALGRAYLLAGQPDTAIPFLKTAERNSEVKEEAASLLAAASSKGRLNIK